MDRKCTMLLFLPHVSALFPRLAGPALISVLAIATLFPVLTADAAVLHPVAKTTITVKETCDGPKIDLGLVAKD
jgi:hypothetical protein